MIGLGLLPLTAAAVVVAGFVAVTPDPTMSRLSVPRPPQERVAQPALQP